jgi:hypothetical protein
MDNVETFEQLQGVTGLIEDVRSINQACMSGTMSFSPSLLCQKSIVDNYVKKLKDNNLQFV